VTNKGFLILGAGVFLIAAGLFAMNFPVFLDAFDQWGWQVNCGTGYSADLGQATIADAGRATDYVDECHGALAIRRAWTMALAAIGWLILAGLLVAAYRHSRLPSEV
jgi:hypothetical protein